MVYFGSTHINHLKIVSLFPVWEKLLPSIFIGLRRCLLMPYITITQACGLNVFEDLPSLAHPPTFTSHWQMFHSDSHFWKAFAALCCSVLLRGDVSPPSLNKSSPACAFYLFHDLISVGQKLHFPLWTLCLGVSGMNTNALLNKETLLKEKRPEMWCNHAIRRFCSSVGE